MALNVGDKVKWTGQANGGSVGHEGVIKHFMENGSGKIIKACVHETPKNKKTGKDLQTRTYFPYVSQLTLA
jgi:hypothetical protein